MNHIASVLDDDKSKWLMLKKIALEKHANRERLTLEETACAMWDPESEKKPMSALGILKIERRALEKLKVALAKYGIKGVDDMFEAKGREIGQKN